MSSRILKNSTVEEENVTEFDWTHSLNELICLFTQGFVIHVVNSCEIYFVVVFRGLSVHHLQFTRSSS